MQPSLRRAAGAHHGRSTACGDQVVLFPLWRPSPTPAKWRFQNAKGDPSGSPFLVSTLFERVDSTHRPHAVSDGPAIAPVCLLVLETLGADRIGVRLSPLGKLSDIHDDNPESTFGYLAERLSDYGLAYLHTVNPALERMQNEKEPDP
jgi:hypothetical protein